MNNQGAITNSIFYLIYSSQESKPFSEDEILALLHHSRDFNLQNEITGLLLYVQGQHLINTKGRFMQIVEGNEDVIRKLYRRIEKDSRHENVELLQVGVYNKRSFPDWTMGFEECDSDLYKSLSANFDLQDKLLNCDPFTSDAPLDFLQAFYPNT